jgi:hypothetical protein
VKSYDKHGPEVHRAWHSAWGEMVGHDDTHMARWNGACALAAQFTRKFTRPSCSVLVAVDHPLRAPSFTVSLVGSRKNDARLRARYAKS